MIRKKIAMLNKKNLKWVVILLLMVLALSIPGYTWMKKSNHDRAERRKSLVSPIIMVPGSSASVDRFDPLIKKLNKNNQNPHSVLKVKVMTNGSLKYSGAIAKGDNEPIIVIGFENNKDGYSNIKKQAGWLNEAFKQVTDTYKFNNFKAFGHSNGGLIWTYWLEHYYSDYSEEIQMKRLMTLATPYNFNESSISHKTQMLSDFIKYKKRLPKSLIVYSLSGGESYESDGTVPEASVAAAKYIFQNQVKQFTEMTVTGTEAGHSDLPQNKEVVAAIKQYLVKKNNPQQQDLPKVKKRKKK